MALTEYRQKRNFKATPEPAGDADQQHERLHFVIQKHAARRLHYDFRLELDGVLKSWAVPKGPSLDPEQKSLAVRVEDHPLSYELFEGVIPAKQYGGGTVLVWDRGVWEPEGDPHKGLKAGKLTFHLQGEKLEGRWSLVRMRGRESGGKENWLLIKSRDDFARDGEEADIVSAAPLSVLSGRDLDSIAAAPEAVWHSNHSSAASETGKQSSRSMPSTARKSSVRAAAPTGGVDWGALPGARKGRLPSDFRPQLATASAKVPAAGDWLHEIKFDGYRLLARFEGSKVRLVTRNGQDWTHRFPEVAARLAAVDSAGTILDGEVVALNPDGSVSFQKLQNVMRDKEPASLVYYVFDVPFAGGWDLRRVPLLERKQALSQFVRSFNPANDGPVRYGDHLQGHGEEFFQQVCSRSMEGIVCKRASSHYTTGRGRSWLKVKCLNRQEFVIGGYTKPSGSRVGFGALLLGYFDEGRFVYCGRVGTGFDNATLRELKSRLDAIKAAESPFDRRPTAAERRGAVWVRPELVAEVEFGEWTGDGRLRHPAFVGLREDKPAAQVVREQAADETPVSASSRAPQGSSGSKDMSGATNRSASKPVAARGASSKRGTQRVEIAGISLSNPDRVLYPDVGITKQALAEYYVAIADWILPHVARRPLSLVRCPAGRHKECFYQKHVSGTFPDAVQEVEIEEQRKKGAYAYVTDAAGLVALVQMGVLEIHPWPARIDNLERPDLLVLDLDPDEAVDFAEVCESALAIRDFLMELGLQSFARTSGGKGLHVCVPVERRTDWDEFKSFAKGIADAFVRHDPKRFIATASKARRTGKIFIDWMRNGRGATAIVSYGPRARSKAPVATPVAWEELQPGLRPDAWNVSNLPARLSALKADPWDGFFNVRQSITKPMLRAVGAGR